jgi:hypothetical protein
MILSKDRYAVRRAELTFNRQRPDRTRRAKPAAKRRAL